MTSIFTSLEISLERRAVCQVEKEGYNGVLGGGNTGMWQQEVLQRRQAFTGAGAEMPWGVTKAVLSVCFFYCKLEVNVQCLLLSLEDCPVWDLSWMQLKAPYVVHLEQDFQVAAKQVHPFRLLTCQQPSPRRRAWLAAQCDTVFSWYVPTPAYRNQD